MEEQTMPLNKVQEEGKQFEGKKKHAKKQVKNVCKNNVIKKTDTNLTEIKQISKQKETVKKTGKDKKNQQIESEEISFNHKQKIKQALIKKALGFVHNEVVEEFVFSEDGELKLSKRKVTKKFSPPDIPAAKILLEEFEQNQDLSQMTIEELEREKRKLLEQLEEL